MSHYANSDERSRLIAGLRDLAEFLDQNPQIPVPRRTDLLVFPPDGSDTEMFAEVDVVAQQIGATASSADSPAGHYSAARDFGPVRYRAVAIPNRDDESSEGIDLSPGSDAEAEEDDRARHRRRLREMAAMADDLMGGEDPAVVAGIDRSHEHQCNQPQQAIRSHRVLV